MYTCESAGHVAPGHANQFTMGYEVLSASSANTVSCAHDAPLLIILIYLSFGQVSWVNAHTVIFPGQTPPCSYVNQNTGRVGNQQVNVTDVASKQETA